MKQKLKALASLCLALALTLCLTLPAWAAGDGDAAGQRIASDAKGSISLSWDENTADDNTVTATAYKVIDVNYHYAQGSDTYEAPEDPEFTWVQPVTTWLSANDTYKTYIDASDNSVTEGFSKIEAAAVEAFTDDLAAAIRQDGNGGIQLSSVGNYDSQTHKISNLEMGSYLILVEGGTRVYKPVFVTLAPTWNEDNKTWNLKDVNQNVTVKSSSLGITKTVVDGIYTQVTNADQPNGKKYAQVAIGDTVTYILEADVPQYPASATATGYYISDNLPNGMTVDQIQVFGVDANTNETSLLRSSDDASKEGDEENKTNFHYYSTLTEKPQRPTGKENEKTVDFVLSFVYDKIKDYSKIRVVYTAKVNENIQVVDDKGNTTGNQNIAYLDYNNNPYETPVATWETDYDTATVYTYGIKVTKTDDKDADKLLAGAEFQVYKVDSPNAEIAADATPLNFVAVDGNDGTYRVAANNEANSLDKVTTIGGTSATDHNLTLSGLDVGTYILKETKAPDGYNLPSHTFSVKITDGTNADPVTDPDGLVDTDKSSARDGYNEITITNTKGFTLPTTGGMGTVLFTAGGVVLMGAGLVLLVVFLRRRRAK